MKTPTKILLSAVMALLIGVAIMWGAHRGHDNHMHGAMSSGSAMMEKPMDGCVSCEMHSEHTSAELTALDATPPVKETDADAHNH